ncbi:MAG: V-type ATPase subunit [Sedimentisphaerales bacterium]|nr:V-type ATPase subunit [Sedimentisphaerales bacterium]
MTEIARQSVLDFYTYPPVGPDDWQYAFQTAQVRSLETQMLTRAVLLDMINSQNFEQAADLLSASEYALPQGLKDIAQLETMLQQRRTVVRELFSDLMLDESIVRLFKARDDFANLRLALRRSLTEKPIGADYSPDGNIAPEQLEHLFSEQGEFSTQQSTEYIKQAVEQAVLAYYQDKDIRQIDYQIDSFQAEYNLKSACRLNNIFLINLFRIQIDLTNIRTMFRLKFTESENIKVFLTGGFVESEKFKNALEIGYEALGQLFFATPYNRIVETGAGYLSSNKSFLKVEQQCEEYLTGFLKSASTITAGHQPVVAFLLLKENEIRTVRLVLTAKKNFLDTKLIMDRIGQ